ncbi:MAG: DUF4385 domain-containing protein [Sphingobacteriales bacterium]|nr:MAG: DUF4385 domain-containing protein [Sphingobacteriales bacterium]
MARIPFDYTLNYKQLDLRTHPEWYRVGKGEQGVLLVEPYKSEILPYWRFKTPAIAQESAEAILKLFEAYRDADDLVGMDMARKFLQMGYTRARRYANHKGGKKYDGPVPDDKKGQSGAHGRAELPRQPEDGEKVAAARIFYGFWKQAAADETYIAARKDHIRKYETT